jgi:hypothetical protein
MRFAFKTTPQNTTWTDMLAVWRQADDIDVYESGWNTVRQNGCPIPDRTRCHYQNRLRCSDRKEPMRQLHAALTNNRRQVAVIPSVVSSAALQRDMPLPKRR